MWLNAGKAQGVMLPRSHSARMLISDRHQFIFVHLYKTAGVSIKEALRPYADSHVDRAFFGDRVLHRIRLKRIEPYPPHLKAYEVRERFPDEWGRYFTFAFVRNPWAWQVSLYSYMRQRERHWQHDIATSFSDFEEYLEWRVAEDKHLQQEFLCDWEGNIMVDFVGRVETIEKDFEHICDTIGVAASLPHKNKSKHRNYRDYYDGYTRALVAEHFAPDIEQFGYDFDGVVKESIV
jgi:hypothetical protein